MNTLKILLIFANSVNFKLNLINSDPYHFYSLVNIIPSLGLVEILITEALEHGGMQLFVYLFIVLIKLRIDVALSLFIVDLNPTVKLVFG